MGEVLSCAALECRAKRRAVLSAAAKRRLARERATAPVPTLHSLILSALQKLVRSGKKQVLSRSVVHRQVMTLDTKSERKLSDKSEWRTTLQELEQDEVCLSYDPDSDMITYENTSS